MKANDKNKLWWLAAGAGALLVARSVYRNLTAYDFSGKIVLITGGSRGFGLVMARQLASEGARLVLCARDETELENARMELAGKGADVLVQKCDVTVEQQVNDMITNVLNEYGPIDVLINNAGIISAGPVAEMTLQEFEEAMNTHFWGPLYTTLAVLPSMKARQEGRILNIASIGGKISVPHLVPYSASKFALVGLSEGLRAELKKYNITVTTANPGLMRTGSPRHAIVKGHHKEEYALFKIMDSSPLTSISAEESAKQVLDALRYGEAEVTTTLPAKFGELLHGISPGLMSSIFEIVNRVLPGEGGIGKKRTKGYESESDLSFSKFTESTDEAAVRNNEV
ncbi:SDR family NAD(P)-dependent oxidoreductase [Pontibacter cellulosilyticus]|uniref:SDR family NAD(P)-dependent oxidoreductase n=1 Tax=Pontibacter cellulosilyticus TaxID=1720253 RepID=A0A923SJY6_9BACT|nr:SDR family NAD(P)-dependent oxidoreductase [Pontibacter cellulosilyticus]MBC5994313.1 SDR family NAD(P)-dependent oxidoreductase [Pontibacter cellulosilyticus]